MIPSPVASSPAPYHPAEKCDSRGGRCCHDLLRGRWRASARHFLEESQRRPDIRGWRQGKVCIFFPPSLLELIIVTFKRIQMKIIYNKTSYYEASWVYHWCLREKLTKSLVKLVVLQKHENKNKNKVTLGLYFDLIWKSHIDRCVVCDNWGKLVVPFRNTVRQVRHTLHHLLNSFICYACYFWNDLQLCRISGLSNVVCKPIK